MFTGLALLAIGCDKSYRANNHKGVDFSVEKLGAVNSPFSGSGSISISGELSEKIKMGPANKDTFLCKIKDGQFIMSVHPSYDHSKEEDKQRRQYLLMSFQINPDEEFPRQVTFNRPLKDLQEAPLLAVSTYSPEFENWMTWEEPCTVRFKADHGIISSQFKCRFNATSSLKASEKSIVVDAETSCALN